MVGARPLGFIVIILHTLVHAKEHEIKWDLDLLHSLFNDLANDFAPCATIAGNFPRMDFPVPVYHFTCGAKLELLQKECPDTVMVLNPDTINSSSLGPFQAGYHTILIFEKPVRKDYLLDLLRSKVISNILKLAIVSPQINDPDAFSVYSHNVYNESDLLLLDVWRRGRGYLRKGRGIFAENMMNLHGRTIRASAFDFAPFTTSIPGGKTFDGIEFQIFNDLATAMNFKVLPQTPISAIKWDGIITDIRRGLTDFGVAHFFLTYPRSLILDYTPSFNVDPYCFLVPPGEPYPRWMGLILPLHWTTWIGTLVTCTVCLIFVYLYGLYYKFAELSPDKLVLFLYGSFVDHSHLEIFLFKAHGFKIFLIFFLLCFYVLTMGYRGSLVSYFTAPYFKEPMNTIREIVDSSLPVRSLGNTVKTGLNASVDPLMLKLDAKYEIYNNLEEGFKNVTERRVALLESGQMAQYRIANDYTDDKTGIPLIHIAKECIRSFPIVFYLRKNNIYTVPISRTVEKLKESGLAIKRTNDLLGKYSSGSSEKKKPQAPAPLTLYELQGAFLVVITFSAGCFVVMVIENIVYRLNKNTVIPIHISVI